MVAGTQLSPARCREIAELRLLAQGVIEPPFATPQAVATHLGCLQGQHLGGVLAATALRLRPDEAESASGIAAVVAAFAAGTIVRGYPMRGTIFLVSADDIAWMTEVTRDRQLAAAAKRRREHGFTDVDVAHAADLARAALAQAPGGSLSRTDLTAALAAGGVALDGGQRYHLLYTLIVTGDLVHGPLHGSDHHLVDAQAWLPRSGSLAARFNGDSRAAIAEWLRRYLVGHGPATVRDFSWWTKLPLGTLRTATAEATAGLESYGEDGLGETCWGAPGLRDRWASLGRAGGRGILLPPFDEVVLGYPDRELIVSPEHHSRIVPGNNGVFRPTAHRRGRIVGVWRTSESKPTPVFELDAFEPLSASAEREFAAAFARYPRGRP